MPLATMTLLSATQEPGAGFIILAAHAAPEKLKATPATAANTAIFDSALVRMSFPLRLRTFMLHRRRNRARRWDVAGEATCLRARCRALPAPAGRRSRTAPIAL